MARRKPTDAPVTEEIRVPTRFSFTVKFSSVLASRVIRMHAHQLQAALLNGSRRSDASLTRIFEAAVERHLDDMEKTYGLPPMKPGAPAKKSRRTKGKAEA